MASLVVCYAAEDESAVRELGRFIEANVAYQVQLEECRVRTDFDLIEATERALSADAALVVLTPASVPKTWNRAKWEAVFFERAAEFETPLGFALLRKCRFPELLRRQRFFDLSQDVRQGSREVKHWLMRSEGVAARTDQFAAIREAVGDRPGVAVDVPSDTARSFATVCAGDFERVHRVWCHGRSAAGILGDAGYAAGIRLPGNVEQNRAAMIAECAVHRWLLVFEGLAPERRELVNFGGRSSVIIAASTANQPRPSLDQVGAAFLVATRDEAQCAGLMGAGAAWTLELLESDFESGLRLGWALLSVLKSAGRFAESVEILAAMEAAARRRGDEMALFKIEWEQSWICEDSDSWGVRILPTADEDVVQLSLF